MKKITTQTIRLKKSFPAKFFFVDKKKFKGAKKKIKISKKIKLKLQIKESRKRLYKRFKSSIPFYWTVFRSNRLLRHSIFFKKFKVLSKKTRKLFLKNKKNKLKLLEAIKFLKNFKKGKKKYEKLQQKLEKKNFLRLKKKTVFPRKIPGKKFYRINNYKIENSFRKLSLLHVYQIKNFGLKKQFKKNRRSLRKLRRKWFWKNTFNKKKKGKKRLLRLKPCFLVLYSFVNYVAFSHAIKRSMFKVTGQLVRDLKKKFWLTKNFLEFLNYYCHNFYKGHHKRKNDKYWRRKLKKNKLKPVKYYKSNKFLLHIKWLRQIQCNQKPYNRKRLLLESKKLNAKLSYFWFQKTIYRKIFIRYYWTKLKYLKKIKKKTLKLKTLEKHATLENRIDIVLVKLGFFRGLYTARGALTMGFVWLNFRICRNLNTFVKKNDSLHVSFKNLTWFEGGNLILNPVLRDSFVPRVDIQFDRQTHEIIFMKILFKKLINFLYRYLIMLKLTGFSPIRNYEEYNFTASPFFFFNLIDFDFINFLETRKRLKKKLSWKTLDVLTHLKS